ncbi:Copia protein [Bienertia sinuspersici]
MKLKCDHCGMRGHTKEGCFELNGYPEWYKKPRERGGRKFAANVEKEEQEIIYDNPLDEAETDDDKREMKPNPELINVAVKHVMKAFNEKSRSSSSKSGANQRSCNFAGKIYASNAIAYEQKCGTKGWIIDSGASDHMVGNKELMWNLNDLNKPIQVRLPDGSLRKVNKIGTVVVNEKLKLRNVFYLPDFKHNLMSVSKLIEEQGLMINFDKRG